MPGRLIFRGIHITRPAFLWAAIILGFASCGSAFAASTYKLTDLGAGKANAINDLGQIVGVSSDTAQAFLYDNGVKTSLGGTNSCATDISNNGQIVGYALSASGYNAAFLFSGGSLQDIGDHQLADSYGYSINNSGQVAGHVSNGSFLYTGGSWAGVYDIGVSAIGLDINEAGQVVGYTGTKAIYYNGSSSQDIGSLGSGYLNSKATAINNSGKIIGYCIVNDIYANSSSLSAHAFLYKNGAMTDLGSLYPQDTGNLCIANDINDAGLIVGKCSINTFASAFIYEDGVMQNLNPLVDSTSGVTIDYTSGWYLQEATSINSSGEIVGYGLLNGELHAFLLTPVPEPSCILVLGVSFFGLVGYWGRKRK